MERASGTIGHNRWLVAFACCTAAYGTVVAVRHYPKGAPAVHDWKCPDCDLLNPPVDYCRRCNAPRRRLSVVRSNGG